MLSLVFLLIFINFAGEISAIAYGRAIQSPSEYPFQVRMEIEWVETDPITNKPGWKNGICGGSIVTLSSILTAGHCVAVGDEDKKPIVEVMAGMVHVGQHKGKKDFIRVMDDYFLHPRYSSDEQAYGVVDLAIVKLKEPFKEKQVCGGNIIVTTAKLGTEYRARGIVVNMIGWGEKENEEDSNEIREAAMKLVDEDYCEEGRGDYYCFFDGKRSACTGDSGGPVVENGEVIAVIVEGGYYRESPEKELVCDGRVASTTIRVSSYIGWIREKTGL